MGGENKGGGGHFFKAAVHHSVTIHTNPEPSWRFHSLVQGEPGPAEIIPPKIKVRNLTRFKRHLRKRLSTEILQG